MYIAIILFPVAKGRVTQGPSVCECKQNVIVPTVMCSAVSKRKHILTYCNMYEHPRYSK